MKQYFQSFKIGKIFLLALVLRLLLLPLAYHSDLTTNSIWGIYAKEFGLRGYYDWLNFGNYAKPEYPPVSTILFLFIRYLYEWIFSFFWKINVYFPLFPSNFIVWLDKYGYFSLLKLPGIISDLGIGYLIYKMTNKKFIMSLYLFNPGVIFLSSLWGQTESFIGFFALFGLKFLIDKKYVKSFLSTFISIMAKATMLPIIALEVVAAIRNGIKIREVLIISMFLFFALSAFGFIFTDHNFVFWMVQSYITKFITGAHNLEYINLNAFNFWGLILGLGRISDKVLFINLPLFAWAWLIALPFYIFILIRFWKTRNLIYAALLIFYTSFIFLPRMHERYFYPVFIFFPLVIAKFPKLYKVFLVSAAVFLINLYHWWPISFFSPLSSFFDLELTERALSLINLSIFGYLVWNYQLSL